MSRFSNIPIILSFFLISTSFQLPIEQFKKYPDIFRYENSTKVIIDPTKPMKFDNKEFFWSGYYQNGFGLPIMCRISTSSYEWSLGDVEFEDGTKPDGMIFGCPITTKCDGIRCVEMMENDDPIVAAALALIFVIFILIIIYTFNRCRPPYHVTISFDNPFKSMHSDDIDEMDLINSLPCHDHFEYFPYDEPVIRM